MTDLGYLYEGITSLTVGFAAGAVLGRAWEDLAAAVVGCLTEVALLGTPLLIPKAAVRFQWSLHM